MRRYTIRTGITAFLLLQMVFSADGITGESRRPPPKPFASDGCSLWPDRDYADCCKAHDRSYWYGGTVRERKKADQQLRQCVSNKGRPINAMLMYLGTRIGGHGWLPTPFRWGFGYRWPQGYLPSNKNSKQVMNGHE